MQGELAKEFMRRLHKLCRKHRYSCHGSGWVEIDTIRLWNPIDGERDRANPDHLIRIFWGDIIQLDDKLYSLSPNLYWSPREDLVRKLKQILCQGPKPPEGIRCGVGLISYLEEERVNAKAQLTQAVAEILDGAIEDHRAHLDAHEEWLRQNPDEPENLLEKNIDSYWGPKND